MPGIIRNWLERHQHPGSQVLHAIGIPMLVFGLLLGAWQLYQWQWGLWWRPLALIGLSYVLQAIGHRLEGNEMGEVCLVKKILGKPYVAISPRYARDSHAAATKRYPAQELPESGA